MRSEAIQLALDLFHFTINLAQLGCKIIQSISAVFNLRRFFTREMFQRTANRARFTRFQVMAKFRDNNRNIFLDNGFFLVLQSFQAFGNTTTFSNHIVKLFALGGDFPLQTLSLPMVLIGILRVAIHFGQKIHKVRIGLMFS